MKEAQMTVTWQTRLSKMKRRHDEAQSQEKDVNNLGAKRQKTIAEVTERLKRDLQQKLSVFTSSQQEASRIQSDVKQCCDKVNVEVSLGADCTDAKGENNNNVTKEKIGYSGSQIFEKEKTPSKCTGETLNENEIKAGSSSQKSSEKRAGAQAEGKHEQSKDKKEIPKQFKIHNPLGFHSWIRNIQHFMVTCFSFVVWQYMQADMVCNYRTQAFIINDKSQSFFFFLR